MGDTRSVRAIDVSKLRESDAWLLLAVAMPSVDGRSTLTEVIGAADVVQHAILTKEELDGGIVRLSRGGYLTFEAGIFTLTSAGQDIIERTTKYGRSYLAQQQVLERVLGVRRDRDTEREKREVLTDSEYEEAVHAYCERQRNRS